MEDNKTTPQQPAQAKAAQSKGGTAPDYTEFFDTAREFSATELVTFRTAGRFAVAGFDGISSIDPVEQTCINAFLNEGCGDSSVLGIEGMVSHRLARATKFLKAKERFIPERYRMKMLLVLIEIASDPISVQKSFSALAASRCTQEAPRTEK